QAPSFVDVKPLAKLLGLPYFPITPTFPWLGALGMLPYPTKYSIYFGKPLHFRGNPDDWDEVIQKKVDVVKDAIRGLLDRGLEERESIF
ncbi:MAG TPA: glycerol acyltransferase, partial [Acidobacteriota bacterium]|nr:glycerol acyltransferase [Acidobacteriota bacterium]